MTPGVALAIIAAILIRELAIIIAASIKHKRDTDAKAAAARTEAAKALAFAAQAKGER